MRALNLLGLILGSLLLASCSCNSHERDGGPIDMDAGWDACAACPVCQDAIRIRVGTTDGARPADVMVSGATLDCRPEGSVVYCSARDVPPGMYEVTITAPGYMSQQLFFEIDPPLDPTDCCSCPSSFSMLVTLSPS